MAGELTRRLGFAVLLCWALAGAAQERDKLPIEKLRTFVEVYSLVRHAYLRPLEHDALIRGAIEGLLKMDPHAAYLDAEEYRELQYGVTDGRVASIGVEVIDRGGMRVVAPIEDGPAFRAGVKPGDTIVKVDDVDVQERKLAEAVKLLRGTPDSTVKLTLRRPGEATPRELVIVRSVVRNYPVKARLAAPGVAYLRIAYFGESVPEAAARELAGLSRQGELRLIVLDLRSNPGGILQACLATAALFLPENALLLRIRGRTPDNQRDFRASPQDYLRRGQRDPRSLLPDGVRNVPIAVLIDRGTASGSEFVAAALRFNRHALLVGEHSFGRGLVQTVFPLSPAGAIKLTTAQYESPDGVPFEGVGLPPELVVRAQVAPADFGGERDAPLQAAIEQLLPEPQPAAPSAVSAAPPLTRRSIF